MHSLRERRWFLGDIGYLGKSWFLGAGKTEEMPIGTKNRYFSFDDDADFSRVKVQYTSGWLCQIAQVGANPEKSHVDVVHLIPVMHGVPIRSSCF